MNCPFCKSDNIIEVEAPEMVLMEESVEETETLSNGLTLNGYAYVCGLTQFDCVDCKKSWWV